MRRHTHAHNTNTYKCICLYSLIQVYSLENQVQHVIYTMTAFIQPYLRCITIKIQIIVVGYFITIDTEFRFSLDDTSGMYLQTWQCSYVLQLG